MSAFDQALALTLRFEGGHSLDPADPGKETYCGISRARHPDWPGFRLIDAHRAGPGFPACLGAVPGLAQAVRDFYRREFWEPLRLDEPMPERLAALLFDTAVHCGRGRVVRWLQTALGVTADGVVGPATVAALERADMEDLRVGIIESRRVHYASLGPWADRFRAGWENRVAALEKALA